jgi:Ca2+-binding EF-hand superfamily protein
MRAINFLAGLILVLITIPSSAEDASQATQFSNLDKDNDGYVSINEADGHLDMLRHWVDIDKDTNGKLEFSEFSAFETMDEQNSQKAKTYVPPENNDDYDLGAAPF